MSALTPIFTQYPWLWEPISDEHPCGASLDYHSAFLALQQQVSSSLSIEYGEFVQAPTPIKWSSLLPTLNTLSQQTKDIRLIILLIRAHLPQEGVASIIEGTALLIALLERWPEAVHPQCYDEGEYVPEFRHNALAGLDEIEGCVAELRRCSLITAEEEAYSLSEVEQWILSDKTRSLTERERLQQLYHHHHSFFESCLVAQQRLNQLCQLPSSALGTDSLSFPHLSSLLATFCRFHQRQPQGPFPNDTAILTAATGQPSRVETLHYRSEAREKLREIRENFAYYEPSSPLSLLLSFAENSIGLDYPQISQRFPRELLSLLTLEKEC